MLTQQDLEYHYGNDLAQLLMRTLLPVELAALDVMVLLPYLEARRHLAEKLWRKGREDLVGADETTMNRNAQAVSPKQREAENDAAVARSELPNDTIIRTMDAPDDIPLDDQLAMLCLDYLEAAALYNMVRAATPTSDILTLRSPDEIMRPDADSSNLLQRANGQAVTSYMPSRAAPDIQLKHLQNRLATYGEEDEEDDGAALEVAAKRARAHLN